MTKQIPKVWVIQENNNDYSAAETHGEIDFITSSELRQYNCDSNGHISNDIRIFLTKYIPGVDYIIPAGNPMNTALVVMSLPQGMRHNFLKWDGRRATYIPFTLTSDMVN